MGVCEHNQPSWRLSIKSFRHYWKSLHSLALICFFFFFFFFFVWPDLFNVSAYFLSFLMPAFTNHLRWEIYSLHFDFIHLTWYLLTYSRNILIFLSLQFTELVFAPLCVHMNVFYECINASLSLSLSLSLTHTHTHTHTYIYIYIYIYIYENH